MSTSLASTCELPVPERVTVSQAASSVTVTSESVPPPLFITWTSCAPGLAPFSVAWKLSSVLSSERTGSTGGVPTQKSRCMSWAPAEVTWTSSPVSMLRT